jgi:hypothetical protein
MAWQSHFMARKCYPAASPSCECEALRSMKVNLNDRQRSSQKRRSIVENKRVNYESAKQLDHGEWLEESAASHP